MGPDRRAGDPERERRQRETAAQQKCPCGNVAGLGQVRCGRCRERDEASAHREECAQMILDALGEYLGSHDAAAKVDELIRARLAQEGDE